MEWKRLDENEKAVVFGGTCPDCGSKLRDGPSGGLTLTFCCTNGPTKISYDLNLSYIPGARCSR